MKRNFSIVSIFLIINTFHAIINNMVHPVTPSFIHSLKLGDAIFGLAFAAMAITNFIFSFFWGNWISKYPIKNIFLVSLLGYILGQFLFMTSSSTFQILLARFVAGCFISGFQVGGMAYIINQSEVDKRANNLTLYSISNIVAATLGFLIGGQIGNISIQFSFISQIILLGFITLVFYIFLNKFPMTQRNVVEKKSLVKLFKESKNLLNPTLILLLISVFFISSGNIAFDQSFNYYIKDVFDFPPSYNGYLKVVIGIMTLLSNLFITFKLIAKGRLTRSMALLSIASFISAMLAVFIDNISIFLLFSLIFLSLIAVVQPLEQQLISSTQDQQEKTNQVMGIYNAIRSLGMIGGALLSSIFYSMNPKGPFLVSGLLFLFAGIILTVIDRKEMR